MKTRPEFVIRNSFTGMLKRILTAIVSGFPGKRIWFKPRNKHVYHDPLKVMRPDVNKYYHRPRAKPVVEKQTLLREKKKINTTLSGGSKISRKATRSIYRTP